MRSVLVDDYETIARCGDNIFRRILYAYLRRVCIVITRQSEYVVFRLGGDSCRQFGAVSLGFRSLDFFLHSPDLNVSGIGNFLQRFVQFRYFGINLALGFSQVVDNLAGLFFGLFQVAGNMRRGNPDIDR